MRGLNRAVIDNSFDAAIPTFLKTPACFSQLKACITSGTCDSQLSEAFQMLEVSSAQWLVFAFNVVCVSRIQEIAHAFELYSSFANKITKQNKSKMLRITHGSSKLFRSETLQHWLQNYTKSIILWRYWQIAKFSRQYKSEWRSRRTRMDSHTCSGRFLLRLLTLS